MGRLLKSSVYRSAPLAISNTSFFYLHSNALGFLCLQYYTNTNDHADYEGIIEKVENGIVYII
ncbi:hypothetical protein FDB72_01970 [Clostridium botulinum]|uniref:hypothetical protein n=1 Tax=Clostridium botulinum TaxID=1491 RepID=UPI0005B76301|nr:hypothetical protein [Clostridium botulinum]MBY6897130.1 hypothetical protein [Clostridium botulinum]MBY6911444.1 hypothetical protein [Clostridium botulinum]MBY6954719.1 hypothetical protein [Clostridium botulinum]NFA51868.1 hypothetical protein [Clostridium botulinum]NFH06228.1 hypothetical protein [Clostridium botulinum]